MYARGVLRDGWALIVVLSLGTSPVSAQGVPEVALVAPPECADGETLRRHLAEALAAGGAGAVPEVEVAVEIRRGVEGYAAVVTLREREHETRRELADPSCAVLGDAVVLVIAVALVPELDPALVPDVHAEPGDDGTGRPATLAEPRTTPAALASPGPRVSGVLRLAAHGSLGALPGVALGGEVGGGIRYDALRLDVAVRALPLVGARFAVDPALGADVALALGLLRALGVATPDPLLELYAGGGIEVGAAFGRGVGISVPRDAAAPWVALESAVGVAWLPWAAVALVLEAEVIVPVVRPVFFASGLGVVYRPEPVCGALRLGVEARFP